MTYLIRADASQPTLIHFGVKGMKWGERRAQRQHLRSLDRASKAKDKADHNKAVDAARVRVDSGASLRAVKAAKAQYKIDKKVIGKREAKKALYKAREKHLHDQELASQLKFGRERTLAVLGTFGAVALVTAAQAANAARG